MKRLNVETELLIVLWIGLALLLALSYAIGAAYTTRSLFTCEQPRLESTRRTPEKTYYVYSCADGEYRIYKKPLDNQIEGDGVDEQ